MRRFALLVGYAADGTAQVGGVAATRDAISLSFALCLGCIPMAVIGSRKRLPLATCGYAASGPVASFSATKCIPILIQLSTKHLYVNLTKNSMHDELDGWERGGWCSETRPAS